MIWRKKQPDNNGHTDDTADPENRIEIEEKGDLAIFKIQYELLFDDPVNELVQQTLVEHIKEHDHERIVVDMDKVEALGSRFMGTMIAVRRRLAKRHSVMAFANVKPEMLESFRVTQLTDMFEFFDSVEDAVNYVQSIPLDD